MQQLGGQNSALQLVAKLLRIFQTMSAAQRARYELQIRTR